MGQNNISRFKLWRNALTIGLILALIEGTIIFIADSKTPSLIFIQSMLFWLFCGAIVHLSNSGFSTIVHSILWTFLLNIPWFINLAVITEKYDHLPPLVISSLIMGSITGFLSKKLNKKS
ncbi:hypothetical protein EHQ16_19405 [Leptospira kanakyensis]|uniref:Uncharacterized protein n=1 Tax=Leptospira kanakyensis TaxID=2484968 RepID=A0A6N4QE74_9LEPT|nr:hypothetical protein [Leptospira kanakyensis]TGK51119.1 hypothetical protein EHQ11_08975 [Leptospira kanakyensis]TGK56358.1 hypothetical protein EHQ16_19405 [Leptospira kanakyensis]TGK70629.1 hypothetical protein EHQ18_09265 [Leptospira kanakyensis]